MIWFLSGAVAFVSASLGWLFGGMNMSRRDALEMWTVKQHYAEKERRLEKRVDETDRRALAYADKLDEAQAHLAEADAQFQASVQEIHGLREERKSLQLKLDEANRLMEGLQTRIMSIGDAIREKQEPTPEAVYEVKKPATPRKRTRNQPVTTEVVE